MSVKAVDHSDSPTVLSYMMPLAPSSNEVSVTMAAAGVYQSRFQYWEPGISKLPFMAASSEFRAFGIVVVKVSRTVS